MGEQLDYSFSHYGDFGWSFLFLVPLLIIVLLIVYVIIYITYLIIKNQLLKRGLITVLLIGFVIPSFSMGLVKKHNRYGSITIPQFQKEIIKSKTKNMSKDEIIDYSVKLTAKTLKFSDKCSPVTFNKETNAHCVLYAKVLASVCNYAFQVNHINATAYPVVGDVTLSGFNLCSLVSSVLSFNNRLKNFTKDHDFVEIKSPTSDIYVDACIYDLLHVFIKQKN